jgi:hypothetical protein
MQYIFIAITLLYIDVFNLSSICNLFAAKYC